MTIHAISEAPAPPYLNSPASSNGPAMNDNEEQATWRERMRRWVFGGAAEAGC
jgi:hypothetical protein